MARISVRVGESVHAEVERRARQEGVTPSDWVRRRIGEALGGVQEAPDLARRVDALEGVAQTLDEVLADTVSRLQRLEGMAGDTY